MKRLLALLLTMTTTCWVCAQGADSLFNDGHSVEALRTALRSPIPSNVQQQAGAFDDQVLRSGAVGSERVQLVTDQRSERAVQIVGKLLTAIRQSLSNWTIRVLDTNPKVENAFVVGGTYIYVYTGLIDNVTSDDELAFVLGHEISHSLLKHNMRRGEDFTNLLASIIEISSAMSKSDNRKEKMGLIGGTIKAAYSRADEQEADALGVFITGRAGFNALRAVEFFNRQMRNAASSERSSQAEVGGMRQQIEAQVANCTALRNQWNADPRIRSPQNAQTINSTCQAAQANAQRFNEYLRQQPRAELKSQLMRSHPADQDRVAALVAVDEHLKGKRSLELLSGVGQGYNVFMALKSRRSQ